MNSTLAPTAGEQFLANCGAMARGEEGSFQLSEAETGAFFQLMDRHGVVPAPPKASSGRNALTDDLLTEWKRRCLLATAGRRVVDRQLTEVSSALRASGVPVIALKGTAALRRLYQLDEGRCVRDLDLMVPEEGIDRARRALERLGYTTGAPAESREELAVSLWINHLRRYEQPGRYPVEIHVHLLKGHGDCAVAVEEAWREARPLDPTTEGLLMLSPEQFFLHTAVHYMNDLERKGFAPIKGLIDLLVATRWPHSTPNWEALWGTATRWGVFAEAATVASTLNACWSAGIPMPMDYPPLSPEVLLNSEPHSDRHLVAFRTARLKAILRLPGFRNRAYALFRQVFPHPHDVRQDQAGAEGALLLPYYLRRLLALPGKAVGGGVWLFRRRVLRRSEHESTRRG